MTQNSVTRLLNRLPLNCRQWPYYPIEMPLNESGKGPATPGRDKIASITYEVWDHDFKSYASFDNLPDAINEAMRLSFGTISAAPLLDWTCKNGVWTAPTPWGTEYRVSDKQWNYSQTSSWFWVDSDDAAKAAAQADYEMRTYAGLVTQIPVDLADELASAACGIRGENDETN